MQTAGGRVGGGIFYSSRRYQLIQAHVLVHGPLVVQNPDITLQEEGTNEDALLLTRYSSRVTLRIVHRTKLRQKNPLQLYASMSPTSPVRRYPMWQIIER